MLANNHLLTSANEKSGLSTYIAIPIDSLRNVSQERDHVLPQEGDNNIKVIQNLFLKQLADGSICLIETNEDKLFEKQLVQVEELEQYPATFNTTTSVTNNDLQKTPVAPSRSRTILLQPPVKKQEEEQPISQLNTLKKLAPKSDTKYKCIKCDTMFDTLSLYRSHMKWHKCQKKFKCPKCCTGYNIENNLKIHMVLTHTEDRNTKCPICNVNLTFQRAASMKSHLMLHQVEEYYVCEDCNWEFDKEDDFIKHMETHAIVRKQEPKSLTCPYCKVKFEDSKELRSHISDHVKLKRTFCRPRRPRKPGGKKESVHVCNVCNKSFIKNSLLERHERIHSGEKPFKCQFCDRGFTQKGTLQIHLSRHTGVKPYSCTLCPAKFYQKGNLRVHIQKTHTFPGEDQKMYKCSQCTCIFKKIATLNGHVTKAHLNNKDATETEDNMIDDVMMRLKELEKQTSGNGGEAEKMEEEKTKDPPKIVEVDNALNECDTYIPKTNFVQLSESTGDGDVRKYEVRQKKIDDVRWYFCNYCPKKFKKPSDLIRHIRVHTREKPFKCKQCKTAFSLKSTLISHMRTHRTNSEYKCKICNNVFSSLRVLNAHLRKHDFESLPKWQCITCGLLFDDLEKGYKHRQDKGREKPHIIQPFIHRILKQPLYMTTYGSLIFKPPKPRFPNTGLESPTVRPFHCVLCDARFTRRVNLKRHIQFHNGDRKYKCHLCPKAFITSYRLTEHLNYHNNIKNYVCTVCGKKFVTSSLLKRHLIIHNTHRPYQCPYCDKTFKTLLLCRTHIRQVHKKDVIPKLKSEAQNFLSDVPSDGQNLHTAVDFIETKNGNIAINSLQDMPELLPQQDLSLPSPPSLPPDSDNLVIQQLLPTSQNPIQILNANDGIQDSNGYQTIYVNIDNMPFLDNSNLTLNTGTLQPQLKLQNTDSLLLNQIGDLQDNNIIFNIDSLKGDLDLPPVEVFSNVANENEVTRTLPGIAEISTKSINLNSFSEKNLPDKTANLNPLLGGNTTLFPNVTFTDELSLPISIVEGDNSFDDNTTVTIFQTLDSANMNQSDDIYETTNIICINCSRVFTSLDIFQGHSCTLSNNAGTEDLEKTMEVPVNEERGTFNEDNIENGETVNDTESEEIIKGAFECHICKKMLANKFSLDRHVNGHSSKPTYECSVCKKVIHGRTTYMKHLATHTSSSGNLLRSCKYCMKEFKKPSDLKRHLRTHTGEKPFGCPLCDKKFSLKSTLESHIKTHDPSPKQYSCNICNSFFSSKSSLKVHMSVHTGQKPHSCSFCDQKFRTAGNKKSHESLMHLSKKKRSGENRQKITDVLESVASEVLNNMNTEEKNEESARSKDILQESLPSQIVNMIEPSDNLLPNLSEDHVSIDPVTLLQQLQMSGVLLTNDNEPLILDDITLLNVEGSKDNVEVISLPTTQVQSNVATDNLTKTEKIRNLECDICHKAYASKDVLRKHRRNIHGVNKKFPCIKCDKAFGTQDELNKHVKLHSGYRPYACMYCANSFMEEHNLKTHVKRIHHHVNVAKETTNALLNMKFDLPSANIDDPLFNNLFSKKDSIVLLE